MSAINGFFSQDKETALHDAHCFDNDLSLLEVRKNSYMTSCFEEASFQFVAPSCDVIIKKIRTVIEKERGVGQICVLLAQRNALLPQFFEACSTQDLLQAEELQKEIEKINMRLLSITQNNEVYSLASKIIRKVQAVYYREMTRAERQKKAQYCQDDKQWLVSVFLFWKKSHFPPLSQEISAEEMSGIEECCRYVGFIDRLRVDPQFCNEFFEFAFRNIVDNCQEAVSIAAEFPAIMERFHSTHIEKRIERFRLPLLRFVEHMTADGLKKDVQLAFEGHLVTLRDESQNVRFSSNKWATMGEIFDSFALKSSFGSEFECGAYGIAHFQPKLPPVDLTLNSWWKNLAPFETLSKEEVENRYRIVLQPGEGVINIRASRQYSQALRIDGCHAWFETAIPNGDDTFQILPIGKYPDVEAYPKSALGTILDSHSTKRAYLNYPDRNSFYNHRERIGLAHIAPPLILAKWLDRIKKDLEAVREDRLFFQPQGDNCAAWVQEVLDDVFDGVYRGRPLPRYFEVDCYQTTAAFPLNILTGFNAFIANKVSRLFADVLRLAQGLLFGSFRGYIHKKEGCVVTETARLITNPQYLSGMVSLPAQFFEITRLKEAR